MFSRHRFGGLLAGLALIAGIVGWVYYQKGEYARESRTDLIQAIATLDDYAANQDLLDPIVARAHESAFAAAYRFRLPSKRRHDRAFRPDTYHQHAYVYIIRALQGADRDDLALAVERLRARE